MRQAKWFVVALVMMLGMATSAMAQGGGNFDPAQFRQRMMDRLKEQLGATDDEWKALEPKVEKVMEARQASFGGFGFGRRGRGGNGGGDNQPQTPVAKAQQELREAVDNKDTPADQLKTKLAAYRDAREAARKQLADAQKELKELLTQRQEAVMVINGMLE